MTQTTADFSQDWAVLVDQRLAGTLTPTQFRDQLTALLVDQFGTSFMVNQVLAAKISAFVEDWRLDRSMFRDFLTLSGDVTMTDGAGGTFTTPSLTKLRGQMAKGDPAVTPLSMFWQYTFGANEILGVYECRGTQSFDISHSRVRALTASAGTAVIQIKKNGANWGTFTFSAGQTQGVISIASPTLVEGDVLTFHAPSVADATLAFVFFTLAGT